MTGPVGPIDHVVMLGLMGSGKTAVGSALARSLGWSFRDSDADLEAAHGLTARALAERDGIETLHGLEHEHLLSALADPRRSVIAAAASTIDDADCRAALQRPDVHTVWLDGTPEVLADRQHLGDHRPEFGTDLVAVIRDQLDQRRALFAEVADEVVEVDRATPESIVARVTTSLAGERAP